MLLRNENYKEGPNGALWMGAQKIEYPNKQILRINGNSKLIEFMSSSFGIEKVYINMVVYDDKQEKGSRKKDQLGFYLSFADALVLCEDILNDKFAKKVQKEMKNMKEAKANKQTYYPKDLYRFDSGVSAQTLAARNASRKDGKPMSRSLRFMVSAKAGAACAIQLERGPGRMNEKTKGIIPDYHSVKDLTSPDDSYSVIAILPADLKRLAVTLRTHIESYITAQYSLTGQSQESNYLFENLEKRDNDNRIYFKRILKYVTLNQKLMEAVAKLPEKIMNKIKTDTAQEMAEVKTKQTMPYKNEKTVNVVPEEKPEDITTVHSEIMDDSEETPSFINNETGEITSDDYWDDLYGEDVPF